MHRFRRRHGGLSPLARAIHDAALGCRAENRLLVFIGVESQTNAREFHRVGHERDLAGVACRYVRVFEILRVCQWHPTRDVPWLGLDYGVSNRVDLFTLFIMLGNIPFHYFLFRVTGLGKNRSLAVAARKKALVARGNVLVARGKIWSQAEKAMIAPGNAKSVRCAYLS
jgi:hypothetical protein